MQNPVLNQQEHSNGGNTLLRVAVIGGGIAGLSSAYYLSKLGAKVSLFESSDQFGGLGTFFEHEGRFIERFYHCMLPSDIHLLALLKELGLETETMWQETKFGHLNCAKIYPLNTPLDLLRFKPLSLLSRIRVGLTGLYGSFASSNGLDDITAQQWLSRISGTKAFETFWKPLLEAKFGNRYTNVPALWFWTRFNREKGTKKEIKGYIHGGYKQIIDSLVAALKAAGAELRLNSPVTKLEINEHSCPMLSIGSETKDFDKVFVTTPISLLSKLASGEKLLSALGGVDSSLDSQGVINVVLLLKKRLGDFYWTATVDKDIPFQGVVETSLLMDEDTIGGYHRVYLMNYLHRTDALFSQSEEEILRDYVEAFKKLFPFIADDDIAARYVFKAPFVEPIYTLGYSKRKPPLELIKDSVYLATTSQVYPEVTSWNGSVGLVKKVVDVMSQSSKRDISASCSSCP